MSIEQQFTSRQMEQRELLDPNLNCQYIAQKQAGVETLYRSQCPFNTIAWFYQTQSCTFNKEVSVSQLAEFNELKTKFSKFTKYEGIFVDPFFSTSTKKYHRLYHSENSNLRIWVDLTTLNIIYF